MDTYNLYIIDHSKSEKEANYIVYTGDDTIEYTFNKDLVDTVFSTQWGYTSYKIPIVIDNLLKLLLEKFDLSENIEFYRSLGVYFNYEYLKAIQNSEHKEFFNQFRDIKEDFLKINKYLIDMKERRTKDDGSYPIDIYNSIKLIPQIGETMHIDNPFTNILLIDILENGIDEFIEKIDAKEKNYIKTFVGIKEELFCGLNESLGDVKKKAKFIGAFSHIFQIPVITKDVTFTKLEEGKDIDEYIDSDGQKSITSAIRRKKLKL